MYPIIGEAIWHINENNGNKYLVFDSAGESKKLFKKYKELWDEIENEIHKMNDVECKYGKDF